MPRSASDISFTMASSWGLMQSTSSSSRLRLSTSSLTPSPTTRCVELFRPHLPVTRIDPYHSQLHEDDEHYRRLLYTILPNLRSVSCGLSVAIRLVESRPLDQFIIPWRQDCLDSDQLERLVRALSSKRGRPDRPPLRALAVERLFAGRDGLACIAKHLKELEHLSLVIAWGSDVSHVQSYERLCIS